MNAQQIQYFVAGLLGGVLVVVGVGFGWLGWVLEGQADKMARQAVVDKLVPICVAQFKADPDRAEKKEELEDVQFVQKSAFVEQQGWATMPGSNRPNSDVADECVREIQYTDV